jgi:hypothetical protein
MVKSDMSNFDNHTRIEETYNQSLKYLKENNKLKEEIEKHLWAYNEIIDLAPITTDTLDGQFFPCSQSHTDISNSYNLCLEGFYTYSFVALRSVLELGLLGVYFYMESESREKIRLWLHAKEKTPSFEKMRKSMPNQDSFKKFDEKFKLEDRMKTTYETLSNFVHTRGHSNSSFAYNNANFNQFSEKGINKYSNLMFSVISDVVVVMMLNFPIGMQELPLFKKFGLNGPAGGFLEPDQIERVTRIIKPEERAFLQQLSDESEEVKEIVSHIESLPDLF